MYASRHSIALIIHSTTSIIIFIFCTQLMAQQEPTELTKLSDLRWSNRIILIREDLNIEAVSQSISKRQFEIEDRDILWFIFTSSDLLTNYQKPIAESFMQDTKAQYFQDEAINAILIGKDGGVKNSAASIAFDPLFIQIDNMPMQQAEMRSRGE